MRKRKSGGRRRRRGKRNPRHPTEGGSAAARKQRRASEASGGSGGSAWTAPYLQHTVASVSKSRVGAFPAGPAARDAAGASVLLRYKLAVAYRAARAVRPVLRPPIVRLPPSLRWGPVVPAPAGTASTLATCSAGAPAPRPLWVRAPAVVMHITSEPRGAVAAPKRELQDGAAAAKDVEDPAAEAGTDRCIGLESMVTSPQNLSAAASQEDVAVEAGPGPEPANAPASQTTPSPATPAQQDRPMTPPVSAVPEDHARLKTSWVALYKQAILAEATRRAAEAKARVPEAHVAAPAAAGKRGQTGARVGQANKTIIVRGVTASTSRSGGPRIFLTTSSRRGSAGSLTNKPSKGSKRPSLAGSRKSASRKSSAAVATPRPPWNSYSRPGYSPAPSFSSPPAPRQLRPCRSGSTTATAAAAVAATPRRRKMVDSLEEAARQCVVLTTQPVVPCHCNVRPRSTKGKKKRKKSSAEDRPTSKPASPAPTAPVTRRRRLPKRSSPPDEEAPPSPSSAPASVPATPRPQARRPQGPATPRPRRRPPWRSILPDDDAVPETPAFGDQPSVGRRRGAQQAAAARDVVTASGAAFLEARVRQQARQQQARCRPLMHSWFTITSQMSACSAAASPASLAGPFRALSSQSLRRLDSFIGTL